MINTEKIQPKHESKWNNKLQYTLTQEDWKHIYRSYFRTISDNSFISLQYRIIHRIIGTYDYLYVMKISDSNLCGLCKQECKTIVHLFTQCVKVEELWKNICPWVKSKLDLKIDLNNATKILGYFKLYKHFWALNFVLIVTRKYIFTCSKTRRV